MTKSIDGVAELQKLRDERNKLDHRMNEVSEKLLADLVAKFVADVKLLEIPNEKVLEEVRNTLGLNVSKRIQNMPVKAKLQGWEKGVTYYNPENHNESWKGGKKGPKPEWLERQFRSGLDLDAMKAVFAGLQKSK